MRLGQDALLPIKKALRALPAFLPAMKDLTFAYVLLEDRPAAEFALEQLRLVMRDWERNEDAVRLESQVEAINWK